MASTRRPSRPGRYRGDIGEIEGRWRGDIGEEYALVELGLVGEIYGEIYGEMEGRYRGGACRLEARTGRGDIMGRCRGDGGEI